MALVGLALVAAAPASADVGFRDFSYGTGVSAPTGQKPQSKLWWTSGGTWWGVLWSTRANSWTIQKFNKATGAWSDTGVKVNNRRTADPDALWDGSTLYIASALKEGSTQTDARVLVYRFSFNGSSWSSLGSPVSVTDGKPETLVLDKDSTGTLWLTYTAPNGAAGKSVYVAHTTTSQTTWGTPYVLRLPGADNLNVDDISTLVTYGNSSGRYVGVLYSNQNDETLSFARHPDGAGDAASDWQRIVLASGAQLPDDHLNIKALIDDPSGRLFAVVKTSLNDKSPRVPSDPLIVLYTISGTSASSSTVWTVGDDVSRAILMLDSEHQNLHIFGAAPCCSGGVVYAKSSGYNNPSFATGLGTPFIQLASDPKINNVTSAKQTVNSTSGLLVEASDDSTRFYVHNFLTLASTPPPNVNPAPLQPPGLNILPVWTSSPGDTWPQARYDQIRAKGFGVLRFMLHWSDFEPSSGQFDSTSLSTLDAAVARAKAAGLNVVLVPVTDYGSDGMDYYPSWAKTGGDSVTVVRAHADGYLRTLAARYTTNPAVVALEPVSEPYRWPVDQNGVLGMYQQAFTVIRAAAPSKLLIYEPTYGTTNMTGADGSIITPKTNVVFSTHYYYAGGSGAGWNASGTSAGPQTYTAGTSYNPANWQALEQHLQTTLNWLWHQGVPLWIGEYGDVLGNSNHDAYLRDLTADFKKFEGSGVPMPNGLPSIAGHAFWEFYDASGQMSATLGSDVTTWQPFADLLTYPLR